MTHPRQILPGTTWLITRRCSERRFFLRPSRATTEIFLYVLALAAERFGVLVHAFCVMSNHYHLVVTDPEARLPAFVQLLNALVARAVNASIGHWEGFWSTEASYSAVESGDADALVAETAYTLANPVAAGLVRAGREWPGLWTAPEQLGTAILVARRPETFFREDGGLPATVELALTVPPGFASAQEFQGRVAAALAVREAEARQAVEGAGRRFLGRARVLSQGPFARPVEPAPRRGLSPRAAGSRGSVRRAILERLLAFRSAYCEALADLRLGLEGVLFPAGTYKLRLEHGVPCAPA